MPSQAEKILEKMRGNKYGWRPRDFHTLYLGFGFKLKGKKHAIFIHPNHPHITDAIPNHKSVLPPSYAADAVKNIDLLLSLEKENDDHE